MSKRSGNGIPASGPQKRQCIDSASQPDVTTTQPSSSTRRSRVTTVIPTRRGAVRSTATKERSCLGVPSIMPQPPTMHTPQPENVTNPRHATMEVSNMTDTSSTQPEQATTPNAKRQRGTTHVSHRSHLRSMEIDDQ